MGRLVIAGLVGLAAAGAAQAQDRVVVRPGAPYPPPPATIAPAPPPAAGPARWGSRVDGRWWGGADAPGGYAAYRRPVRGFVLPTYWNAPRFYVDDWASFDLPEPPVGYRWVRYHDDAVLIDGRGAVYDTVLGVDWDGPDRSPAYAAVPPPPLPPPYAAPYPPPAVRTFTVPAGRTQTVFVGPGVTTVTVTTRPAVTTTTTEYRDEAVTYTRPARRAYRTKLVRRGKPVRR